MTFIEATIIPRGPCSSAGMRLNVQSVAHSESRRCEYAREIRYPNLQFWKLPLIDRAASRRTRLYMIYDLERINDTLCSS